MENENIKNEAREWFYSLLPSYKNSIQERYLLEAIQALEEKTSVRDVALDKYKSELSTRGYNLLYYSGVRSLRDFTYITEKDLEKIRGCGGQTKKFIYEFAENHGISLKDNPNDTARTFFFKPGDKVSFRYSGVLFKEGEIATVLRVDDFNITGFHLPAYELDYDGDSIYVSPGQIRKVELK